MGLNLKSIFSAGAEKLIGTVGKVIDDIGTNKEEREAAKLAIQQEINRHTEALQASADKEIELQFLDVKNARDSNVAIQESDKAGWLAKNIAYVIDIWMALIWGVFTLYLAAITAKLLETKADLTGLLSIYSTITAVFMITVNFHRGTSQGSADKQKFIDKYLKK